MIRIAITGTGAVSPAGWGTPALHEAIRTGRRAEPSPIPRIGGDGTVPGYRVPPPPGRLPFLRHPRLRRASPVARYALAATLEALGEARAASIGDGTLRCGVVFTVMNACVTYSGRFFAEVLENPPTASPILFPETVFNAPASHISAFLGSPAPNDTLVGDEATYFVGLDLAAQWLADREVDACLVIGAEEIDPVTVEGASVTGARQPLSEGAGAVLLERSGHSPPAVELARVTDAVPYLTSRAAALAAVLGQLTEPGDLVGNVPEAQADCARLFGNALGAAAALNVVAATGRDRDARTVCAGSNQQAAGALIKFH
ncbi:hypothetical protein BH23VER1_BH23VER1_02550 [soil metagenome]